RNALFKGHLGENMGRKPLADQVVHHLDGRLAGGEQGQQGETNENGVCTPYISSRQRQGRGQNQDGKSANASEVDGRGMASHPAQGPQPERNTAMKMSFESLPALVDEIETDMSFS